VWCIYCKPTLYFLDYDWFSIRVHAVHGHGACLASPKGKVYFHDFSNLATQAMGQIIIEKNRMDAKREMHAVSWPKPGHEMYKILSLPTRGKYCGAIVDQKYSLILFYFY
jgi:hypothetical protein